MQHFFRLAVVTVISWSTFSACSKKIIPDKPLLAKTSFNVDSLPDSEINLPVRVNLKPLYALAEKFVDTVYTSAAWPDGWLQDGCATRYRYHFRRGPLRVRASGTTLSLGFTGFYQIVGSTRVCANGAALSPWTPPCRCGFGEGERRVNVGFLTSMMLTPDLKAKLSVNRQEPEPLDKCNVCFWGQDITNVVMRGLKEQLDEAKSAIEKNIGSYDLRPRVQQLWDQLNRVYGLYGFGWLQINPSRMRINNFFAKNDSLNIYLGLVAHPIVSFEKPQEHLTVAPNITDFSTRPGFNIFLDARLNYDSLSSLVARQMTGHRFDLGGGKFIIVKDCALYGMDNENIVIRVDFEGSQSGLFYLTGKPVYEQGTHVIELRDLDFDIRSKNLLVKTAKWLFNHKIISELKKYTRFDLSAYETAALHSINDQLNHEWMKGITSSGQVDAIRIIRIFPLRDYMIVRSNCTGNLLVSADIANFSL